MLLRVFGGQMFCVLILLAEWFVVYPLAAQDWHQATGPHGNFQIEQASAD